MDDETKIPDNGDSSLKICSKNSNRKDMS